MNTEDVLPEGDSNTGESSHEFSEGTQPPIVSSEELLRGQTELWIEHEGERYRLRVTSRGKLLLTK